jgi:predicted HTH domain antitoxin
MSVIISLPENIQQHLESSWGDAFPDKAKEAIAVEGYRSGVLSLGEVAEMLGLSINDADGFLKDRHIYAIESLEEVDLDQRSLEEVLSR